MRIIFCFICTLFMLLTTGAFAQDTMEKYTPHTIFDLPWGNGLMEFGFVTDGPNGEGMRHGPASYVVQNDKIYIYDFCQLQPNLKVFNMQGLLIQHFPVEPRTDGMICVDNDGNILINDGDKHIIYKYSKEGQIVDKVIYGNKFDIADTGLRIYEGKIFTNIWAIDVKTKPDSIGSKGEKIYSGSKEKLKPNVNPRFIGHNTKNFYDSYNYGLLFKIKKINNDAINLNLSESGIFLSEDRNNNIYFIGVKDPAETTRKDFIYKYNSHFKLIAKFELFEPLRYIEIPDPIISDVMGNIFQLYTSKTGVKLIKWSE
jgi:hypothetical protein